MLSAYPQKMYTTLVMFRHIINNIFKSEINNKIKCELGAINYNFNTIKSAIKLSKTLTNGAIYAIL